MIIFESDYPATYRRDEIKKILDFTQSGKFCQLVAVPGVGKATVLKLLAHNRKLLKFHLKTEEKQTRFVYVNLLELNNLDEKLISKFILESLGSDTSNISDSNSTKILQDEINKLAVENIKLVLLFDHFDEYQNELPNSFFELLKNLRSVAKYKFSAVFATRRQLSELLDPETINKYYDFFLDNVVHLKINDADATSLIISQTEKVLAKQLTQKDKASIIKLAGGHPKLTKVITEFALREAIDLESHALLAKQLSIATLDEIWQFLTAPEQEVLKQLANKKNPNNSQVLETLKNFDLLSQDSSFTIPLFEDFVKTRAATQVPEKIVYLQTTKEIKMGEKVISDLLSKQEYKMLRYLIEKTNQIVTRDELISVVWSDAQAAEGISDEALDQMVYRLRKKIETEPNSPKYLATIKGQGWRFLAN